MTSRATPGPVVGGRRRRQAGPYEPFIPVEIADREFQLDGEAVCAVSSAARALAQLNLEPATPTLRSLNALAANLLRSESAASSRIEGLAISQQRLARVAFTERGERRGDRRATEVLGNVAAMNRAIEIGAEDAPFRVERILEIHRALLRFTVDQKIAGVVREEQNWIGGNDFNPIGAAYVPPPPEHVEGLLADLCRFIERDDLAPIAQAAIAHVQFENIHPFLDGNGRVGRALVHTILRRRHESVHFIPPVSLVLANEPRAYIDGFGAYSSGHVSRWVETFADATELAVGRAKGIADGIEAAQERWLEELGHPRSDASVRLLIAGLPEHPVIDVAKGIEITGRSGVAIGNAISQLETAGILKPLSERKWGRVWECGELFALLDEAES